MARGSGGRGFAALASLASPRQSAQIVAECSQSRGRAPPPAPGKTRSLARHQEGIESRMRKDGAHAKRVSCAAYGESLIRPTFEGSAVLAAAVESRLKKAAHVASCSEYLV